MTPYFAPTAKAAPYWCPNCEAWYVVVSTASCCVLHGPGQCCHVSEQRVDPQPHRKDCPLHGFTYEVGSGEPIPSCACVPPEKPE